MVLNTGTTISSPPFKTGIPQAKTGLATKLDPGPPPTFITNPWAGASCTGLFFGSLFLWIYIASGNMPNIYIFVITISFIIGLWGWVPAMKLLKINTEQWKLKKEFADSHWVCLRCGDTFSPDA
jgi:hypothetical protein